MCPDVKFLDDFKKECSTGIVHIVEKAGWAKKTAAKAAVFIWC
jgi:hypothetical protein